MHAEARQAPPTPPQTPLRIGMIGAGWVTEYHLNAWRKLGDLARVVAIADPRPEARQERQSAFGIAAGFATAAQMLDAVELDAVDVCTPRESHAEMVELAAARGLAVICQKPLAPTLAEARALVAGLPPGTRLMVHDNWRFRPVYRRLRAWLDAGRAGRIRAARLDFLSSGMIADAEGNRPALVRQPFFRDLPRLLVSEVLIHHLDTLRYLLGEMQLAGARLERSNADIRGEDVAILWLEAGGGLPVTVNAGLATHGAPPMPTDRLVLYGTEATIEMTGGRLVLNGPTPDEAIVEDAVNYQDGYDGAIRHFVDNLVSAIPFETHPEDNLRTLALVEAAYERAGWTATEP